mmetsp:Transcript_13882/g.29056  ORF Transcript_13882/g.29056 Transcript_13882/m.29056 type:complete len:533 (-) Transcript_13882:82-1680(-)
MVRVLVAALVVATCSLEGAHSARKSADSLLVGEPHPVASSAVQVDAGAGKPARNARELAIQAVERACIENLAKKFESLRKEVWPHYVPEYSCDSSEAQLNPMLCKSLEGLLERRWSLEDMLEGKSKPPSFRKPELDMVKEVIKGRLFSVTWARTQCLAKKHAPREEGLLQCLLDRAANSTNAVGRSHRAMSSSGPSPTAPVAPKSEEIVLAEDLQRNIKERWHLEQELEVIGGLKHVQDKFMQQKVDEAKSKRLRALNVVKVLIKQYFFSFTHNLKACKEENKDDTDDQGARLLSRIQMEFTEFVSEKEGECKENDIDNEYCPEGSGPDIRRTIDMVKFSKVWSAGFAVTKPLAMTSGFAIGMLVGGPLMAANFAALGSVPGPGFVAPVPFALAASMDFFPKCRCYPSKCKYDEQAGYCMMRQEGNPSYNPFHWLPYPGSRCVAVKSSDPTAKVKCEIKECRQKDYQQPRENGFVSGTIGFQEDETGVHNCLSTTGEVSDSLLMLEELPTLAGKPLNNTPGSRGRLYESMLS